MELEWITGKCLAKDAERRYQNAGDLAVDLKNLREKLKIGPIGDSAHKRARKA